MKSSLANLLKLSVVDAVRMRGFRLLARGISGVRRTLAAKPRSGGDQPVSRLACTLRPGVAYPGAERVPVIANDVPVHHGFVLFGPG
jgi:hypothetical protein